jgi:hypothetical protein
MMVAATVGEAIRPDRSVEESSLAGEAIEVDQRSRRFGHADGFWGRGRIRQSTMKS